MNGPKVMEPCAGCGKLCTQSMIGDLSAWLCWTCSRLPNGCCHPPADHEPHLRHTLEGVSGK